jgi:hypothetical protein
MTKAVSINNNSSAGFLLQLTEDELLLMAHLNDVLIVAKVACIHSRALCAKARVVYLINLQASLQNL